MRVALRGVHEINARHDTAGVADDVRFLQTSGAAGGRRTHAYAPPTEKADRAITFGEIVVARRAAPWTPGTMEEPKVRSVLNGLTFVPATRGADKLAALKRAIRPVGAAKKTVKYDASRPDMDPSDDPVVVVTGHMTTTNTGGEHIEAGDAVEAHLVPADTTHQYKDGVNLFSPNRIVMGTRPLHMEHTLAGAILKTPAFEAAMRKTIETLCGGDKAKAEELMKNMSALAATTDLKVEMTSNAMLHAARAATIAQMQNFVGVATSGAEAGEKFNMVIHPFTNLVSRSRPAI